MLWEPPAATPGCTAAPRGSECGRGRGDRGLQGRRRARFQRVSPENDTNQLLKLLPRRWSHVPSDSAFAVKTQTGAEDSKSRGVSGARSRAQPVGKRPRPGVVPALQPRGPGGEGVCRGHSKHLAPTRPRRPPAAVTILSRTVGDTQDPLLRVFRELRCGEGRGSLSARDRRTSVTGAPSGSGGGRRDLVPQHASREQREAASLRSLSQHTHRLEYTLAEPSWGVCNRGRAFPVPRRL